MKLSIEHDANWQKFIEKYSHLEPQLTRAVLKATEISAINTLAHIKTSGRVPVKSGTLKRSLKYKTSGRSIDTAKAVIGTDLPYAAIHEYGGTFTRNKAWGRPTRPYTVTYKARRYLRGGLEDSKSDIKRTYEREIESVLAFR